jgi:hypothetical protein
VEVALDLDRRALIEAELAAIDLWDNDYRLAAEHCTSEDDSFRARQDRRRELLAEIVRLAGSDPCTFRLNFRKVE